MYSRDRFARLLYYGCGASRPTNVIPRNNVGVNQIVPIDFETLTITHDLYTTDFVLATMPNWNTSVYLLSKTVATFTVGFSNPPERKGRTFTWRAQRGLSLPVSAGAFSLAIVHGQNDSQTGFFFTPWWNTAVYITDQTANSITVDFSNPAPRDTTLDYGRYALETHSHTGRETMEENAVTFELVHDRDKFSDVFLTPSWNTERWIISRRDGAATFEFSNPAPLDGYIDWRVNGVMSVALQEAISAVPPVVEPPEPIEGLFLEDGSGPLLQENGSDTFLLE